MTSLVENNVPSNSCIILESVQIEDNLPENVEKISKNQDNPDLIVLSDDSSSQSKESDGEGSGETDIICLTDDENSSPNISNQKEEEDCECIEFFSIDKKLPLGREQFDFDDQEVLDRWRIKKRADPNVNLSMSNYKLRAFGEIVPVPERKFKPNIFFDETLDATNLSDEEKNKIDREALEQKINSYSFKFNQLIEDYDVFFRKSLEILDQKYQKNDQDILHHFSLEKDKLIQNNDNWYQKELNQLNLDRNKKISKAKTQKNQAEKALRDLFDSGCYVKGKFSEYLILETKQPKAKRRTYFDDGKRYLLLPKNQIKNILIEDVIYEYYYGKP